VTFSLDSWLRFEAFDFYNSEPNFLTREMNLGYQGRSALEKHCEYSISSYIALGCCSHLTIENDGDSLSSASPTLVSGMSDAPLSPGPRLVSAPIFDEKSQLDEMCRM
jgi:hypothetical protein